MVGNDFATRYARIKKALADFINSNKDQEIDSLLAKFSVETGISMKKLRQYYEELKLAKLI